MVNEPGGLDLPRVALFLWVIWHIMTYNGLKRMEMMDADLDLQTGKSRDVIDVNKAAW